MCHMRQGTVLVLVPTIAMDIMQRAEAGERTAFASVHTIISSAALLSADFLRKLQQLTDIRRVQQCKSRVLIPCRHVDLYMAVS